MNAPIYQVTKFTLGPNNTYTLPADALVSFVFQFPSPGGKPSNTARYRLPSMGFFKEFAIGLRSNAANFIIQGNPVAQGFFPAGTQFVTNDVSENSWSVTVLFMGG